MAQVVRVVPADLDRSATKVTDHAEGFDARHSLTQTRIGESQAGMPAAAAAAIGATLSKWQDDSAAIRLQLDGHSVSLRAAATGYAATESGNATDLAAVGGCAPSGTARW
ncbi:hypothetical protein LV457_01940 [Mycobacterium sp. MYCO198283]|uniref:WXG100 family type VII secretion target n=1 Tax=Mycobacterium sp. MYCO198283 TaxID=2883505 RepID=UPI001E43BDCA|nr:hypothetical protein [Mycobacterium sp. MYCO198283]MCG5431057.1 hypothetical protein [Mycobacterium sp. MYCO198283]